jgi:carbohydrate-selective porin OprB
MKGLRNREDDGHPRDLPPQRKRRSPLAILTASAFVFVQTCTAALAQSWDKTKEELAKYGIFPTFVYDGNLLTNAAGGVKQGSIFQGNFYAQMQIDGEKFFGVPGLTLFVSELVTHGPNPENGLVGDAQGVNNVTSRPGYRSYEGWVQYNFLGNHWSVLVGQ